MYSKRKRELKMLLIGSIIISFFIFYVGLHAAYYMGLDRNLTVISAFPVGFSNCLKHPIINYTSDLVKTAILYPFVFLMAMVMLVLSEEKFLHDESDTIAGSAKWLEEADPGYKKYNKKFTSPVDSVKNNGYDNMILSNDLSISMNGRQTMLNNNVLVIGGAGTGKSRFVVKPNVLQMNCSYVVTDPSGELLQSLGTCLENNGYTIKVFNLNNMKKSNHYNPLSYIRDDLGVFSLVQCLITNTTPPDEGKGDAFWTKSETALLEAIIFYLVSFEPPARQNFSTVMEYLRLGKVEEGSTNDLDEKFEELRNTDPNHIALKQYDAFKSGGTKTLQSIVISCQMRLASFNIQEIADLTNVDDINLNSVADKKTALFIITPTAEKTYNYLAALMYSQLFQSLYYHAENEGVNSYIVRTSDNAPIKFFRGATDMQKEDALNVEKSKAYTTKERQKEIENWLSPQEAKAEAEEYIKTELTNIKYQEIGKTELVRKKKKKVKYSYKYEILTTSGEHIAYFNDDEQNSKKRKQNIENILDKYRNAKVENVGLRLPIDVRFLLDEFANIGQIPDFIEKLSTMRKYLISCTIILQGVSQIKKMYKDDWEMIFANCNSLIFLGSTEQSATEYINKLLGKRTVRKRGESHSNGKGGGSLSTNLESKELMTVDEIASIPPNKCIIKINGQYPSYAEKYHYEKHPNYKYTEDANPANAYFIDMEKLIPDFKERKEEINRQLRESAAKREKEEANNPKKQNKSVVTIPNSNDLKGSYSVDENYVNANYGQSLMNSSNPNIDKAILEDQNDNMRKIINKNKGIKSSDKDRKEKDKEKIKDIFTNPQPKDATEEDLENAFSTIMESISKSDLSVSYSFEDAYTSSSDDSDDNFEIDYLASSAKL